ncbi:MAG: ubiquinol-cytochrome C chaperone family protein [Pseudomonadota bacterium]
MRLFKKDPNEAAARALYERAVAQARQPVFYRSLGVPDSLDGRFELIVLHVFLLLHRLRRQRDETAELAQALFDVLFLDMDVSLREMGAGDIGVSHKVKAMVQAFYGRVAAYEAGLQDNAEALEQALARNLYGTVSAEPWQLEAMAGYLRREVAGLADQDTACALEGRLAFGAAPEAGRDGQ